jgi:Fe-S cluster assembly iron-binding protein IscA
VLPRTRTAISREMQFVDQPEPTDVVVAARGVHLFLNSQAADALDEAELVVDDGEVALALPEAAAT